MVTEVSDDSVHQFEPSDCSTLYPEICDPPVESGAAQESVPVLPVAVAMVSELTGPGVEVGTAETSAPGTAVRAVPDEVTA